MRYLEAIASKLKQAESSLEEARALMQDAMKANVHHIGPDEVFALADAQHKAALITRTIRSYEYATQDLPETDDYVPYPLNIGFVP